jgi:nitrite reductase/ring-hydroxylating ferredoxin subunit
LQATRRRYPVAECEVCGNDYDKAFEVSIGGESHTFDSFECAIHAVAPRCAHCGCTIIGHGVEDDGTMYCCAHCAEAAGVSGLADRA